MSDCVYTIQGSIYCPVKKSLLNILAVPLGSMPFYQGVVYNNNLNNTGFYPSYSSNNLFAKPLLPQITNDLRLAGGSAPVLDTTSFEWGRRG